MKLILLTTLLSLTLANTLFRTPLTSSPPTTSSSNITDYWTGLFAYFNLSQPTQFLTCFNQTSSSLYFKNLNAEAHLAIDTQNRSDAQVYLDVLELKYLRKLLKPLKTCFMQTQDWQNLLNALDVENPDPKALSWGKRAYYQAYFGRLSKQFSQVLQAFNSSNYTAGGSIVAEIMNDTAVAFRTQGFNHIIWAGVSNGVHLKLGLPDANDSVACWNNATAAIRLEVMQGLANAVANGSWQDAANNSDTYLNTTGYPLLSKVPASVLECVKNSTDFALESKRLGIDISSQAFNQKVYDFAHQHQLAYWELSKAIKDGFDRYDYLGAGGAWGQILLSSAALPNSTSL